MPPVVLAVQFGVALALAKTAVAAQVHGGLTASPFASVATGAAYELIWLLITLTAVIIVYSGTQDSALTLGFVVVGFLEGQLIKTVFTASVLASLGLAPSQPTPHTPQPATINVPSSSPRLPPPNIKGTGPTVPTMAGAEPVLQILGAPNPQGTVLNLSGPSMDGSYRLIVAAKHNGLALKPGAEPVAGLVKLNCHLRNGTTLSLPSTQTSGPADDGAASWNVTLSLAAAIAQCTGSITTPNGRTQALGPMPLRSQ